MGDVAGVCDSGHRTPSQGFEGPGPASMTQEGSVTRIGAKAMFAAERRPGDSTRRTDRKRKLWLPASPPACEHGLLPSPSRLLANLFLPNLPLLVVLFAVLSPLRSAAAQSDATNRSGHFLPISTPRTAGVHAAHSESSPAHLQSLIQQVQFNQKVLSFEQGVTVGPEPGDLEIQFAPPASAAADPLHYRLLGFDTEWKDAGKAREVVYNHLPPGHYEFDFQQVENGTLRASVVQGIPITVMAPYWQMEPFRSLGIIVLLLVVFTLYKLRVGYLVRHAKNLQEKVSQTKAELTLAATVAGDAQEALKDQALRDSLTGLWNRRAIFAMLEREVCRAQRDRFPITLVMIDLDHFKNINDTYGHLTGDEVLRETAGRLFEVMRPYDFAGRYGGEEFLVVLPGCSPHNGVQRAEDFRRSIAERPVPTAIGPLAITCSLGVAAYDNAMPPEDLIHRADAALYRAKRLGRNCVCAGN